MLIYDNSTRLRSISISKVDVLFSRDRFVVPIVPASFGAFIIQENCGLFVNSGLRKTDDFLRRNGENVMFLRINEQGK